jgi:hypothetical protein
MFIPKKNNLSKRLFCNAIFFIFTIQAKANENNLNLSKSQDENSKSISSELSLNSTIQNPPQDEIEIKKKVKFRSFPGGRDEQEIKIINPIFPISRKMSPILESPIIETPDSNDDNDDNDSE